MLNYNVVITPIVILLNINISAYSFSSSRNYYQHSFGRKNKMR